MSNIFILFACTFYMLAAINRKAPAANWSTNYSPPDVKYTL